MKDSLLSVANEVLEYSNIIIKQYFRKPLPIINKSDMSPVTIADRETEIAIRRITKQHFPLHSILGEEGDNDIGPEPYTWIIDPIDGTKSFISGNPLFGTLLCISKNNQPLIGIIDMPIIGERWVGVNNSTLFNDTQCESSQVTDLDKVILYCTEPNMFNNNQLKSFNLLEKNVRLRRFGGDCYNYGLLASGHIDLVVEANLSPHDWMALIPVIEGSGGLITDWSGNYLNNFSDGTVIAVSSEELHRKAIKILNKFNV